MTSNNPFTNRIRQAAQEGYVNGTRRDYSSPFAVRSQALEFPVPATERQISYIESLLSERDLAVEQRPKFLARLTRLASDHREVAELSKEKASALIEYLQGLPVIKVDRKLTSAAPISPAEVPAGHYAMLVNDSMVFVQVDRPVEGKWAGRVFVSLQHGDESTLVNQAATRSMLAMIREQGVIECSIRYGREIGKCGVCHRRLTNAESRAAGIGPVCRETQGW